ncbi:unnamed protein product [Prunus armeniaca]|uniref:Uncharacterized protein n=1 Tax=Prunus armeniaca TaxID=36596 RepID=A0A6J5V2A8_PRUAR|nr:unnamed protein product [Prunus armeniaca]
MIPPNLPSGIGAPPFDVSQLRRHHRSWETPVTNRCIAGAEALSRDNSFFPLSRQAALAPSHANNGFHAYNRSVSLSLRCLMF